MGTHSFRCDLYLPNGIRRRINFRCASPPFVSISFSGTDGAMFPDRRKGSNIRQLILYHDNEPEHVTIS
jgi:hypothetical protein